MATHSSILAWKIPWIEEPGVLQSMGPQKSQDMTENSYTLRVTCVKLKNTMLRKAARHKQLQIVNDSIYLKWKVRKELDQRTRQYRGQQS